MKLIIPIILSFLFSACKEGAPGILTQFKFSSAKLKCETNSFNDSIQKYVNRKFYFEMSFPKSFDIKESTRFNHEVGDSTLMIAASGRLDSTYEGMVPGINVFVNKNHDLLDTIFQKSIEWYSSQSQLSLLDKGSYKAPFAEFKWFVIEAQSKKIDDYNPVRTVRGMFLYTKLNDSTELNINITEVSGINYLGVCDLIPLIETFKIGVNEK